MASLDLAQIVQSNGAVFAAAHKRVAFGGNGKHLVRGAGAVTVEVVEIVAQIAELRVQNDTVTRARHYAAIVCDGNKKMSCIALERTSISKSSQLNREVTHLIAA